MSWIIDYSASTVTILEVGENINFITVLIDVPGIRSSKEVQLELLEDLSTSAALLEVTTRGELGGTIKVDLPRGAQTSTISTKLLKAQEQLVVKSSMSGEGALIAAATSGDTELLVKLIEKGRVNPNCQGHTGLTALMVAAGKGNLAAVELLIGRGVDIDVKDQ
eukprot:CAMPEP_0196584510 /NCGR_PEP_ID=MMETSP1081-20130531/47329_1 /TAXON_ID=36882 /ORGANISM="Pyramimonas amylifera, Strain CCMP720" /LENGTH=163 /DNA_ID=CAMNT_0041905739 /DNA_START=1 /DNA_END=489 /DNA_ORIENTATION=+